MKFKSMQATVTFLKAFLGIAEVPVNAEEKKVSFNEDQNAKLKEQFGDQYDNLIDALNTEINGVLSTKESLGVVSAEIKNVLEAAIKNNPSTTETPEATDKPLAVVTPSADVSAEEALREIKAQLAQRDAIIAKLAAAPEDDVQAIVTNAMRKTTLSHSATHLFADTQSYNAFENRPWNARMRDQSMSATDFNADSTIPLLQGDMEHFVRENPEYLTSLINEYYGLPLEWDRRTGVLDRIASAGIIPAEIVQGRSKGWSPKNKFNITPEEGKVYPKKIDISFTGYELQQIETTWIRSYNKEGSHPWKMTFVYFLLGELMKRAMADDTNAQINGIFVENPGGDDKPGRAVNSQNGLLYLYHYYRDIEKKYRPFKLGRPTKENIVDYVKQMVESIPELERNAPGLELQLSATLLGWYRERAGLLYKHSYNTDTGAYEYKENYVMDYPNIKFQPIPYMTNTEFMAITASANVEIMEYDTTEKSRFTFTFFRRNIDVFADYRLGIRLLFVGTKLAEGDPREFEVQKVWSNDVPVFPADVSAPIYDDTTGILKLTFPAVKVDEGWKSDIKAIEGAKPGQIIKIYGNKALAAIKNVKKNATLLLTADYALNTDGVLTLLVQADGKFKELSRTDSAPVVNTTKGFTEDVLDITGASQFAYEGAAAATLKEILNGNEGNQIKIQGNDTLDADLTISANNVIKVDTPAVLKTSTDYIELICVAGVWYEVNRVIA
ncbi:hypothetical protein [Myroides odoratimimus]|uniref:Uncharacterized protein n=1 Tax=Myroides odoratimimus CIP 101113 TaxID=883154 RepID=A0AAV3F523_9FLAO|nr:hypothetical protein [Myroides odoratimimus]EHO13843.1 hypothetical protein HMPREF9715_00917 [Myroides odoratimimus CIP 101113]